MNNGEGGFSRFIKAVINSLTFRLVIIGVLILVMLYPVSMVRELIDERAERQESVVDEITSKWGGAQTIVGPILTVPYEIRRRGEPSEIHYLHLLPEILSITGDVRPTIRYRGLYEAVLFNAELKLSGSFLMPDLEALGIERKSLQWSRATTTFGVSDLLGVADTVLMSVDGVESSMDPGEPIVDDGGAAVSSKHELNPKSSEFPFEMSVDLNGSRWLGFIPVGKITTVSVQSSWADPSFAGAFLPSERNISDGGFTARWQVLHVNRDFPQCWIGDRYDVADSEFGLKLFIPVAAYQKSMRMAKYAVLFIGFTFAALFLCEVIRKKRVHPFQYLLIGLALVVFYTLLISISEHIGFGKAYAVSSAATVLMVICYARTVLGRKGPALVLGTLLGFLYGYLYVVLQLETYSLVLGSGGLFVILAGAMFLTRKINWYSTRTGQQEGVSGNS